MLDMFKFYEKVFQYCFFEDVGVFVGYLLGNFIIVGLLEMQGLIYNVMQLLSKFFYIIGKIYFFSDYFLILYVVFQDGIEVVGESYIVDYLGMIDYVYVINIFNDDMFLVSC